MDNRPRPCVSHPFIIIKSNFAHEKTTALQKHAKRWKKAYTNTPVVLSAEIHPFIIIRVMEGSLAPVACLDRHPNECERCNECQTLFVWEGLDRVIQSYLEGITLQDVLAHPLP